MLLTKHALLAMQRPAAQNNWQMTEMSEGRRTQIVLLDDRRLDIVVQPRLFVGELLNIVASHCHLKDPDKQYFGLTFYDEKNQCHWLQSDRRVLDHEYPRKFLFTGATLILRHQAKFYVESITQLAHSASVELMFLQTRTQLQKGILLADQNIVFQLGALAMQTFFGDFTNPNSARTNLKRLALLPAKFPATTKLSLTGCEDRIIEQYENLSGASKGNALVNYMTYAERLHTYGVHAYEVKDKAGVPLILGISSRGIYQYEPENLDKPKKGFHWKQLENLYYRERKFSIEVHDPKRVVNTLSSFNVYEEMIQESEDQYDDLIEAVCDPTTNVSVSRRAFIPSNVYVHVFFCENAQLCKTIWSLAIAQHQFYLDKRAAAKQKGSEFVYHTPRELSEKLDQGFLLLGNSVAAMSSTTNLLRTGGENGTASSDLGSSVSSQSVHSIPSTCSAGEKSEDDKQREAEMCKRLRQRKRELDELMSNKIKELKDVCIREGEITGVLPAEIHRALIPGEAEPKIKRRVGTAFAITTETMSKHTKADQIAKFEADVDIHKKIVAAALKLASDASTNKSVRRKRRRDYESARQRLRELEQRLHQLRLSSSKPDLPIAHLEGTNSSSTINEPGNFRICKSLPNTPRGSMPDLTDCLIDMNTSPGPSSSASTDQHYHRYPPLSSRSTQQQQHWDRSATPSSSSSSYGNRGLQHSTSFPACGFGRSVSGGMIVGSVKHNQPNGSPRSGAEHWARPDLPNGHRSQSIYQSNATSSYRGATSQRNNHHAIGMPIGSVNRRADSNHSLQSNSSAGSSSSAAPLGEYDNILRSSSTNTQRSTIASIVEHDIGAYNIPNQRTSWDYECLKQMNAEMAAAAVLGSSESLNIGLQPNAIADSINKRRAYPISNSTMAAASTCYTGSLDRRVLRQRQRDSKFKSGITTNDVEQSRYGSVMMRPSYVLVPPCTPPIIEPLDRSPTRYGPPPSYPGRTMFGGGATSRGEFTAASAISPRLVHKLLQSKSDGGANGGQHRRMQLDHAQSENNPKYGQLPHQRSAVQRSLSQSSTSPVYGNRMTKIQEQQGREELVWYGDEKKTTAMVANSNSNKPKTATIV